MQTHTKTIFEHVKDSHEDFHILCCHIELYNASALMDCSSWCSVELTLHLGLQWNDVHSSENNSNFLQKRTDTCFIQKVKVNNAFLKAIHTSMQGFTFVGSTQCWSSGGARPITTVIYICSAKATETFSSLWDCRIALHGCMARTALQKRGDFKRRWRSGCWSQWPF